MTEATAAEAPTAAPRAARPTPWLLLAAVVTVVVPFQAATRPLNDIDLYWHLLIGQEILDGTPVAEAGRGWSFAPVPDTWVTTQWLAEVLFAWLHSMGGFGAMVVYRTVTVVIALAVLAAVTLYRRPARAAVWPYAIAGFSLALTSQERSQQITYILAPLVGWWAMRLWREGRVPRWWVVLPLVVVWANMHGGWLLVPLALLLAAAARALDHGLRDRAILGAAGISALAGVAACISPIGIDNALAVLRFSGSTATIGEWKPVILWDWQALPLILLGLLLVVAWARGRARPTRGELLLALGLLAFGFQAWRSVTPASLMLAPLVVGTLARALGEPDPLPAGTRQPMTRVLVGAGIAAALVAPLVATTQPVVVPRDIPVALLSRLADAPQPLKVLNTYNVSGPVLWFGGGPEQVTVGIDGRADRYGAEYIERYTDGLVFARPGWDELFDQLDPDVAVLRVDQPLTGVLVAQRGWTEVAREGSTVLLRAPDVRGLG